MKTSELNGAALDWAVAKCEGMKWPEIGIDAHGNQWAFYYSDEHSGQMDFSPSTNWAHGGSIIGQHDILVGPSPFPQDEFAACIGSDWDVGKFIHCGPTHLIAAMRCYVNSKLGNEVEIPEVSHPTSV